MLVDGGLLNPVPVSATLRDLTDCTIAVDINAPAESVGSDATGTSAGSLLASDEALRASVEDAEDGVAGRRPPKCSTRRMLPLRQVLQVGTGRRSGIGWTVFGKAS